MKAMSLLERGSILCAALPCALASRIDAQQFHYLQGGTVEKVSFLSSNTAFGWTVHEGGKILRTEDSGQSWEPGVVPNDVRGHIRGIHFLTQNDGWACGDGGLLLQSTDGGANWSVLNANNPVLTGGAFPRAAALTDIHMVDDEIGYAVGFDGTFARTENGWATIIQDDSGGPVPPAYSDNSVIDAYDVHFFGDGEHGIIATDYQRFYRTSDYGATWNMVPAFDSASPCPPRILGNIEMWAMAWEDPDDPESAGWATGGVGTNQGYLLRTADGGLTWEQTTCFEGDSSHMASVCGISTTYGVAMLGSSPEAVAVGYASTVHTFQTGTPNWNACNPPGSCEDAVNDPGCGSSVWKQRNTFEFSNPPLKSVARISATEACMVGNMGVIRRFLPGASPGNEFVDEGSLHWLRVGDGDFTSSTAGCVITQGNVVKRTTDGGLTWSDVYVPGTLEGSNFGLALEFEGAKGVAVGGDNLVLYTTNSGASWTATTGLPSHYLDANALDFAPSSDTVYGASALGKVYKSTDAGVNWSNVYTGSSETLYGVSFATASTGYVVGSNATAYKTTSGGSTWTTVSFSGGTPSHLFDVATWGDGSNAIAVGAGGAVYIATGGSFVKQTIDLDPGVGVSTPTVDLRDVEVLIDGSDVHFRVVGNDGVVLFRNAAGTWTSPKSQSSDTLVRASFDALGHGFIIGTQFTICEYD